jgi:hypothetical protein
MAMASSLRTTTYGVRRLQRRRAADRRRPCTAVLAMDGSQRETPNRLFQLRRRRGSECRSVSAGASGRRYRLGLERAAFASAARGAGVGAGGGRRRTLCGPSVASGGNGVSRLTTGGATPHAQGARGFVAEPQETGLDCSRGCQAQAELEAALAASHACPVRCRRHLALAGRRDRPHRQHEPGCCPTRARGGPRRRVGSPVDRVAKDAAKMKSAE